VIDIEQVGYHEEKRKEKKSMCFEKCKALLCFWPTFVEEKLHATIGCPPTTLQNLDMVFTSLFLLCKK
jgi:hypothetical protein